MFGITDNPKGLSVIFFVAFTAASSLLIYSPAFLFNKIRSWVALAIATVTSLILWADIVYFRYFGSILKIEALQIAGQTTGVQDSVAQLISLIDILFFLDIVLVAIYITTKKKGIAPQESRRVRIITALLVLVISMVPITAMFTIDWTKHLRVFIYRNYDLNLIEFRYGAIAAHSINTYRALLTAMERLDEAERASAVQWIKTNTIGQTDNKFTGRAKGKNIYLIQFESLQDFVIGRKFEGQEITPNLNRLVSQSYYFNNGQTAIGGGGTSDSDFTANTSIYPLQDSSVFVQYGRDDFTSLPKVLKSEGYNVNAYHAYRRDFWNRGTSFNSLGFDHFYSKEEYESGEKVVMGLNDESFYRQTLTKLTDNEDPQFNYLISLSSHHPFLIPTGLQKLAGSVADHDLKTFNYYQAIHYADYSLGLFLEELKKRGTYENSLIVVYGDHQAKVGDPNTAVVQEMIEGFDIKEMDKIPFIYKLPNQVVGTNLDRVTSQLDLMPTILNLTGTKTNYPMFGGDALAGTTRGFTKPDGINYSELLIRFNLFEDLNK